MAVFGHDLPAHIPLPIRSYYPFDPEGGGVAVEAANKGCGNAPPWPENKLPATEQKEPAKFMYVLSETYKYGLPSRSTLLGRARMV